MSNIYFQLLNNDVTGLGELESFYSNCEFWKEGRKEMFYLTTHSTHFIYGYMVSDRDFGFTVMFYNFYIYFQLLNNDVTGKGELESFYFNCTFWNHNYVLTF